MSVIDTLVYDRTQNDVDYANSLVRKALANGWSGLTEAEQAEYSSGLKGAYNASDLNRVGNATAYLYGRLAAIGYDPVGYASLPTDWTVSSVPDATAMSQYLSTVSSIKETTGAPTDIPTSMVGIDYIDANRIEKVLAEADATITRIQNAFIYSGEMYSGEPT